MLSQLRRVLAALLLAVAVAALTGSAAAAQTDTPQIIGSVIGSDGAPVEGVVVDLFEALGDGSRGSYLGSTASAGDGAYRFALSSTGCHVIVAIAPAGEVFENGTPWDQQQVCLDPGQTEVRVTSRLLVADGRIAGSVAFEGGGPATGVVVDLFDAMADGSRGTYHRSVATGADGRYHFDVGAGRCHVITVIAPDGSTFTSGSQWDQVGLCLDYGQPEVTHDSVLRGGGGGPGPGPGDEEENLELILSNPSRNTSFDDNEFRDVPMDQIQMSDLTVPGDLYTEPILDTSTSGYFRVKCEVSHFAYDDPIVHPDRPGAAHLHMFFGNTQTNAFSTYESLLNSGTGTCNGEDLNRTAYWVPALLDRDGNALIPFEIMVYYKNTNFRLNGANHTATPFAPNLQMIAGDAGAREPQTTGTGGPGSTPIIRFSCGQPYADQAMSPLIPDCRGTNALEMNIAFPACYDPERGTYQSDQSHMSYPLYDFWLAECPASHPVRVSSIMYRIFFWAGDYGGALTDLHLSSDVLPDGTILPGGTTAHADWFGAWHPETLERWTEECNNTQVDCEIGLVQRNPDVSLIPREEGFYPDGYLVPPDHLLQLCPGRELDPANPLVSVANCHHGAHGGAGHGGMDGMDNPAGTDGA